MIRLLGGFRVLPVAYRTCSFHSTACALLTPALFTERIQRLCSSEFRAEEFNAELKQLYKGWPQHIDERTRYSLHNEVRSLFCHIAQHSTQIPDQWVLPTLLTVINLNKRIKPKNGTEFTVCMAALHQAIKDNLDRRSLAEVVQVMWILSQQDPGRYFLFPHLQSRLLQPGALAALEGRDFSKLVYALAKLKYRDQQLITAVGVQAANPTTIRKLDAQGVVNVLWGLTKLQVRSKTLVSRLMAHASRPEVLSDFTCQSVANLTHTLAILQEGNAALLHALAKHVVTPAVQKDLLPAHVAQLAWSYASLQVHNVRLARALGEAAVLNVKKFQAQEVSNTLFYFATFNVHRRTLLDKFAAHILELFVKVNPDKEVAQALSSIVWAYGELGYNNASFIDKLRHLVVVHHENMNHIQTVRCAIGLSKLGEKSDELYGLLAKHLSMPPSDFIAQMQEIAPPK